MFCNPAFELEGEREEIVEGLRTCSSTPEPIKPPVAGESAVWMCNDVVALLHHLNCTGSVCYPCSVIQASAGACLACV